MMKAIIVDDEPKSRLNLELMLAEYCSSVQVAGNTGEPETAAALIRETEPDIVFMDVELQGCLGFELLHEFPERKFDIIFVTAYDDYALRALKEQAMDYLLKPIDHEELEVAIRKVHEKRKDAGSVVMPQAFTQAAIAKSRKMRIPFEGGIKFVDIDEVVHIKSTNNYSELFLANGTKILCAITIGRLEEQLKNDCFIRVHQSHLINLNHVVNYYRNDGGWLEMSDNSQIQVSRRKKEELLRAFLEFSR
ncbi:LytR/AlgR family response regulator transcription factor [Taibaiella soli]|uniref:DNA-binding response regulator n=1 Tax=Taibaiella soli TaxID=1649169 RepID=A0A2W2ATJ2_9BACT|nr:LytTR family DNA-binding domain-containing protein [Taibaiella soli]PZF71264.1 DNA-binding response regulator [Taibaiella soli]